MATMIASEEFDVVLGSRILGRGALAGGMPVYKYVSNRFLTLVENLMIGQKLSDERLVANLRTRSYTDVHFPPPVAAGGGSGMSRPVSHSKPPGKPTMIRHRPTNSEVASAASAGIPNPARTTTNPNSRTPHPASETGTSWIRVTGGTITTQLRKGRSMPRLSATAMVARI